jgi:hypothetical protein
MYTPPRTRPFKSKAQDPRDLLRPYRRARPHNATHARHRGVWSGLPEEHHNTLFIARGYIFPTYVWSREPLIIASKETHSHLTMLSDNQPRTCRWCLQLTEPHEQAGPITKASCYCKSCASSRRTGYYHRTKSREHEDERFSLAGALVMEQEQIQALTRRRECAGAHIRKAREIQARLDSLAALSESHAAKARRLLTPPTTPAQVLEAPRSPFKALATYPAPDLRARHINTHHTRRPPTSRAIDRSLSLYTRTLYTGEKIIVK